MDVKSIYGDNIWQKVQRLHWPMLLVISAIVCIGLVLLYAAGGGHLEPYASRQAIRFMAGLGILIAVALIDLKFIYSISYFLYVLSLILLALVPIIGYSAMGAQRWIDLGFINIQPSEFMKISLILALARYYHRRPSMVISEVRYLIPPLMMIALPFGLTAIQPDLGTAMLMLFIGLGMMFACGVSWKFFALIITTGIASMPLLWHQLHEYQQKRILTFLDPERDPLGAGYHIMQSKIAIGSAGFWGKGFMEGSQAHLQFLPEKHTDFIFTLLTEDFGLAGACVVMGLYLTLLVTCMGIALRSFHQYGTALAMGVTMAFFFYIFINIAMVIGLMPVVGVPMPLVSYGGTALLTLLIALGLVMNVHVNRTLSLPAASGVPYKRRFK